MTVSVESISIWKRGRGEKDVFLKFRKGKRLSLHLGQVALASGRPLSPVSEA